MCIREAVRGSIAALTLLSCAMARAASQSSMDVSVVPEPGTLVLGLTGAVMMGWIYRRQIKQRVKRE